MQRIIKKANVLIEALPYIQRFRGKTVVIKYGGSVIGKKDFSETVLQDVVFMECIGINPVLIHGGGHAISSAMKKLGKQPRFVNGLRVTDKKTISIVEDILLNRVNAGIVKTIKSFGGKPVGISGKKGIIKAKKHLVTVFNEETEQNETVDIGFVGDITGISAGPLCEIIKREEVPVIAPLAYDGQNNTYNINADIAAGVIAATLQAEKLVFLTDVEGIMKNPEDKTSLISTLKTKQVKQFIDNKIIQGGMIPKVSSCLRALAGGVHKTHIIDGRIAHSLLLEIFTDKGIGTEIVK